MNKKRENGEVVVEASIVVSIALIFITVMLFIGIVLYHQTMLTAVANKTAASVAQLYSNSVKDPFTGYVDSDSIYQAIAYDDFKTDEYLQEIEVKANALAKYRLNVSSMLKAELVDVDVQLVNKPDELLKSQLIVTLKGQYNVPLVGIFNAGDGKVEFSVTGRADCVDLLEYVNGVEAIGDPEGDNAVPIIEDTCVVTFMLNKYDGGFYAAVPVLKGKSIISSNHFSHSSMPYDPIFNNLVFTGWVTENGAAFNKTTTVNSDVTVYGSWLCTVTFDPTGGSVSPTQKTVGYNKTTSFPNPTRSGYAFDGWYTQKDGQGTRYYSNTTAITSNVTLYAKWNCTHDFNATEIRKGTCLQRYRYRYDCVRCPYSYEKDGDWGICEAGNKQIKILPTCTTNSISVILCKYCSKVLSEQEDGQSALGHKLDKEIRRESTCYSYGFEGKECTRTYCDYEEGNHLPLKEHTIQLSHTKVSPTCKSTGVDVYRCVNAGCTYTEDHQTPTVDHSYYGRCGTMHQTVAGGVADDCAYAKKGDRYYRFECVVCEWCGKFEGTKQRKLLSGKWITTSKRVWCVDHIDKQDLWGSFNAMPKVEPPGSH